MRNLTVSPVLAWHAKQRSLIGLAVLFLVFLIWIVTTPAFAASPGGNAIDWMGMSLQLFGGLALFLFGMEQMASSLKQVAGERMKDILGRLTGNRFVGMITGAFVTAIIQSSSVTTVILVGFVATGLMSLAQAVGVIFGANIGTTITAQIVAFKVTKFALLFVTLGFGMMFAAKKNKIKQYGSLIMGLGLIFYGMAVMSVGMKPLRSFEPFIELMGSVSNPLIGIAVAAAFTALVQSSSATLGVIIALAMQGLISLEGGIAMALGANVGTCVTAGLAAIGQPREAVRVAVAHVLFNVIGVLLIVGFIPYFADLIRSVSPNYGDMSGQARLAAETPRQIANAHSIFNAIIAIGFMPFLSPFARLCERLVPDQPLEKSLVIKAKYLDPTLLETPVFALDRARFEIGRMAGLVNEMLKQSLPTVMTGTAEELEEIADMDADVDALYAEIIDYLGRVSVKELSDSETKQLMRLFEMAQRIEDIGDTIETGMVMLGLRRIADGIVISPTTLEKIMEFHAQVVHAMELTADVIKKQDGKKLKQVKGMKQDIARMAEAAARHEVSRLTADAPNRVNTYTREVEIIDYLSRIFKRCRRVAKTAMASA